MAKLGRHYSLEATDRVIEGVDKLLKELPFELEDFRLQAYSNGREQGYYISNYFEGCAFGQQRNSDQIILYIGPAKDFSMQGNVPSDEIWKNAKTYDLKHVAAEALFCFIIDELLKNREGGRFGFPDNISDKEVVMLLTSKHPKVRQLGEALNEKTIVGSP